MTLAIILLLQLSCATSLIWRTGPRSFSSPQAQSVSQDKPASAPNTQNQPGSQSSTAPVAQNPPAKRPLRKKKVATADCNPTPSASADGQKKSTASEDSGLGKSSSGKASKPKNQTASNCPPKKKIVNQGGTTEPAIQLVGTPGGTASSQERDTSQKLQSTEDNLKKMESEKLNSNQQDMIKQIRQFVAESKTATAAGDFDRASTLADKAKLLSEELLSPPKE